ncbi:MAG: DUF4252 domain-containing protein [Phaeodactylibacter sp.]|nr:DUF4252 domain-containing protein [Phaeodactylibacter sp.]
MRNPIFLFLLVLIPFLGHSQTRFISEFYDQYKNLDKVSHVDIQGWLLQLKFNEEEAEGAEKLLDKITKLRILTMDDGNLVSPGEYQKLLKNMRKGGFEELFRVREGQEDVGLFIREENKKVTNVLLTIHGQDNFIMLSLEGLLKFSDLNDLHLDIEGMEHFEKLPEKKEDIPRV